MQNTIQVLTELLYNRCINISRKVNKQIKFVNVHIARCSAEAKSEVLEKGVVIHSNMCRAGVLLPESGSTNKEVGTL